MSQEGIVGHLTAYTAPTGPITFEKWHWCSFCPSTTTAYLNTLFNFFEDIGRSTEEDLNQTFIEVWNVRLQLVAGLYFGFISHISLFYAVQASLECRQVRSQLGEERQEVDRSKFKPGGPNR